ncbi:Uncharacterised protein [Mycobacteroides abscessus subsp. abscessus]|nr:Uncharacterised protein [Mycobacteroides abscessus subsp. abscessus]SKW31525.1 Uncharacterised protein [Mycobacteroides abscessus subsp. abscessus]
MASSASAAVSNSAIGVSQPGLPASTGFDEDAAATGPMFADSWVRCSGVCSCRFPLGLVHDLLTSENLAHAVLIELAFPLGHHQRRHAIAQ